MARAAAFTLCMCVLGLGAFAPDFSRQGVLFAQAVSDAKAATAAKPAETAKGDTESRQERMLKYAEQRAENAEAELKQFKETHETSVRACSEATQRKQKELEICQGQAESLRTMFNSSQSAKAEMEKKVRELEAKQAVASSEGNDKKVETYRAAAEKAEKKAQELSQQQKALETQLEATLKEHDASKKEAAALLAQLRSLEAAVEARKADAASAQQKAAVHHIFSLASLKATLSSVGLLYMSVGEHLVAHVPQDVWDKLSLLRLEAATVAAPYVEMASEKVWQPLAPAVGLATNFFWTTVYPLAAAGVSRGLQGVASLTDDFVPSVNGRVDAALEPLFKTHPSVEALVPPHLADRLGLLVFLVGVTYFLALLTFRFFLCPILTCVCPCCCKRRSRKSKNAKKFQPAQSATVHKDRKGQPQSPARPFALSGADYKKPKA
ncbi:hypothetical protein BESB_074090 [Besnoitia besnoiti]|uniref:Transmembrane protein n=1 Tax=Besnoitia besnoiti TaxID=94643 RepID=A0A2A9MF40_BESBE|nr:uncharacterized protein BESB_074090 [Besnoitia besnoiti]PFH34257.1 hypothetical protein BESB_074090 [Besnoitia besnoiti]